MAKGLVSHDSNHSIDLSKQIQVEVSNQDSMLSKHSSDGHLSIVISDDNETKMENCDDSHQSKSSKTNDSNSKHFEVSQDNSNKSSSKQDKKSDHKSDDKSKTEKSKSHDKHKSRHDSKSDSKDRKDDKDRKSDRDRKDHKDKHVSKDRDKSKDNKDRKDSKSYSKSEKDKERGDKDKNKSSSSSRHRSSSSSREKSNLKKESISKDKDRSENSNKEKLKSSTRDHKDSRSKDDKSKGDSKIHSKYESKSDRYKKDEKHHSKSEKHSSSSKSKEKDKKDSKKHKKENKDDHFSSKKRFDRRSTDRDSNDGQSGLKSSSSSFDSYLSSQTQNKNQESSNSNSGSGESGNSDSIEEEIVSLKAPIMFENKDIESIGELLINTEVQTLKLIKPKFASNIHEARRLMKIRKHLHKLEKEDVRNLANVLHNREKHVIEKVIKTNESVAITPENVNNDHMPNILKKQNKFVKTNSLLSTPIKIDITELKCKPKEKSPEPVSPPLKTAVVSAATWDALEAKLNQSIDYSTCYDVPDTPEKNEMQVTSTTPSTSKKDELQIPLPNLNDCLYLECTSPKTERYIKFVKTLIMKLEKDVESSNKRFKTIDHDSKTDLSTAKLQQFAQKKSLKRKITDIHSDVRNNNKKFNHHIEVHENFSLPLSPAESDKSIDKKSDSSESSDKSARKAGTESIEKTKRTLIRASTKTQRYSSEDLYKPRPLFSGSRRRTGRNLAID